MAKLTAGEVATGGVVLICAAVITVSLFTGLPSNTAAVMPSWDSLFKIIAIIGAGVFFAFKALSGYNNVNLSIMPTCRRVRHDAEQDYIEVHVMIEKGATSAFSLEGVQARFNMNDRASSSGPTSMNAHRIPIREGKAQWDELSLREGMPEPLYISPGDKMQFGCIGIVPAKAPLVVEIIVFGRRRGRGFQAQWRASAVSLPNAPATFVADAR